MGFVEQNATYYRAALLLGVVRGEAVVAWAESVIENRPTPPIAVIEAAMTPPGDLTALRLALQPVAAPTESPEILSALFDRVRIDLLDEARDIRDSIRVLGQVRRHLTVTPHLSADIDTIEDDFMLATAGVTGDVAEVSARAQAWLDRFAGSERVLLDGLSGAAAAGQ
jgi:hypothetical protein